jgi:anti-sigma regulatory factor (Ser/Thr protein kinase)
LHAVERFQTRLVGAPASVTAARRFTEVALQELGLEALSWEVVLLVSELVTNSVLHARGDLTLEVESPGPGEVRIAVSDGSTKRPAKRTFSDRSTTGRGLRLLEEVSSSWGVTTSAEGKTVWAVCRLQPQEHDGRSDGDIATDEDLAAILAGFPDVDGFAEGPTVRWAA